MVVETTMRREDKQTKKIDVDKVAIVEEVIVQILNVIKNIDIAQRIATPRREWKKMQI